MLALRLKFNRVFFFTVPINQEGQILQLWIHSGFEKN